MHAIGAAAALGALAGGRTFAIPALLSRKLEEVGEAGAAGPVTDALAAPGVSGILTALAATELVADKLPVVGPRTDPRGLIARIVAGAISGAAAAEMLGRRPLLPAIVGAAAAFAGAHVGYHLRRRLRRAADVPDPLMALAEDAVVLGAGNGLAGELMNGWAGVLAGRRYGEIAG